MTKLLALLTICTAVFFVYAVIQSRKTEQTPKVAIDGHEINVWVARSNQELSKGLGGVSQMNENQGMIFIFTQKDIHPSFWMKDMLIPLDMIWINDGKVAQIHKDVPPPQSPTDNLPLYTPDQPIDYVLEVNAGFSDRNGIEAGDSVEFLGFN